MKSAIDYLTQCFNQTDKKGKIYTSLKKLKTSNEICSIGLIRVGESFARDKKRVAWDCAEGNKTVRKIRQKIWKRTSEISVIIADSDDEKVELILEQFLVAVERGFYTDGNWTGIEIKEAEWMDEGDHVLKPKCVVQFSVIFTGGIYKDVDAGKINMRNVVVERRLE